MTRSAIVDATAWRYENEFNRLTIIYLGFFSDKEKLGVLKQINEHKEEHRQLMTEGSRLADLKKSHDEWCDAMMDNIKTKQTKPSN